MKDNVAVKPDDDVASADWYQLGTLAQSDFAFKTVHPAIAKLKTLLG